MPSYARERGGPGPAGRKQPGRGSATSARIGARPGSPSPRPIPPAQTLFRLRGYLPGWLCDRDTWSVINATAWMLLALYVLLFSPI